MIKTKSIKYVKSHYPAPVPPKPPKYPPVLKIIQLGFQTLGRIFPKKGGKYAYRLFTTPVKRAKHKFSDKVLESAKIFEVLYGKGILKGYEWGSGDKTILLVHGWESRGTGLRSFVPELVKAGFRVIAFDGPAHGNSDGKRTNLPHFAGGINAVINQIGGVYGIIAHSFGGPSSVYALVNAETDIKKLVFIAVPSGISGILSKTASTLKLPKSVSEEFKNILSQKIGGRPIEETDVAKSYGKFSVEDVLVVHDKNDDVVHFTSAEKIFENWENANLLITEGLGHYRIMKNTEVVRKVGVFLSE